MIPLLDGKFLSPSAKGRNVAETPMISVKLIIVRDGLAPLGLLGRYVRAVRDGLAALGLLGRYVRAVRDGLAALGLLGRYVRAIRDGLAALGLLGRSRTTSRAALSWRSPMKTG